MRIVGGNFRGRKLTSLPGATTRPTADRVKEALFNIWGQLTYDALVLDLFAGSGALGLEALSRGAQHVTFVEKDRKAIQIVRTNVQRLQVADRADVVQEDVFRYIDVLAKAGQTFDLITADPPYGDGLAGAVAEALDRSNLLRSDGRLVIEHHRREELPADLPNMKQIRVANYGDTRLTFFGRKATR